MGDSAKVPFTVNPQNDPDAYAPSLYVYAQPDGNIRIDVPNKKRVASYRIKFYEADKQLLFELKQLPSPSFQLDKTNFLHSGCARKDFFTASISMICPVSRSMDVTDLLAIPQGTMLLK